MKIWYQRLIGIGIALIAFFTVKNYFWNKKVEEKKEPVVVQQTAEDLRNMAKDNYANKWKKVWEYKFEEEDHAAKSKDAKDAKDEILKELQPKDETPTIGDTSTGGLEQEGQAQ